MKFFYRILLSIFPLIIVPLLIGMTLTTVRGNTVIRDLVSRNARLELVSFLSACQEEYGVLSNLGISDIDFYHTNSQNTLIEYALNREIPSGFLYVKKAGSILKGFPDIDDGWITYEEPFTPWDWRLGIAVSRSYLRFFVRENFRFTLLLLVIMLAPVGYIAYLISKRVSRPLVQLENAAGELSRGVLTSRAEVPKDIELGNLARTFNTMARNIENLTESLEKRVEERTAELERAMDSLREAQDRMIQSEKLSALGHLTSGIAHELNTPLGAVLSVSDSLSAVLVHNLGKRRDLSEPLTEKEGRFVADLIDRFLVKQERPEILVDRAQRLRVEQELRDVECDDRESLVDAVLFLNACDLMEDIIRVLSQPRGESLVLYAASIAEPVNLSRVIQSSARQAVRVVDALRSYIETGEGNEQEDIDLGEEIDSVLVLLQNKIRHKVTVATRYAPGVVIRGDRQMLNLLWLNIIKNALDAMDYNGELTVDIRCEDGDILVEITDTGTGIPPDIQGRIFEPFFTTKSAGAGIGLGLDVSKRIVEKMGGSIGFASNPGETRFYVRFPNGEVPV